MTGISDLGEHNNGDRMKIFVYGAGGHAKVVIDMIECRGIHEIAFLIDDACLKGSRFCGYEIAGGREDLEAAARAAGVTGGIIAIGDNKDRSRLAGWLGERGFEAITAVHPSAQIGSGVMIGGGTAIMPGTVINRDAILGPHVIVNTNASVDHDCCLGAFSHIAPGSTLCGTVKVGEGTLVGAGSTIIPNLTIGKSVIIRAGSTVVRDMPDAASVLGAELKLPDLVG